MHGILLDKTIYYNTHGPFYVDLENYIKFKEISFCESVSFSSLRSLDITQIF